MSIFLVSTPTLRSFKNALKDRLPLVKSSHISEAVAYSLGFNTNIALVTQLSNSPSGWTAVLSETQFHQRLSQLDHSQAPRIAFDSLIANAGMPPGFSTLLAQVATRQARSGMDNHGNYALQDKCKAAFAAFWGLGRPDPTEDNAAMALRLERGVDHSACRIGWGELVGSPALEMRFPGTDHAVRFYQRLPLSEGRYVEYSTGLVSMPYLSAVAHIGQLPAAETMAEALGWEAIVLPEWTWYVPFSKVPAANATTLVLYRRKERHEETLRAWSASFKRWALENVARFDRAGDPYIDAALGEVIESPHFPLTVASFEDLRESYLSEYSHTGYQWKEGVLLSGMERLFAAWTTERQRKA